MTTTTPATLIAQTKGRFFTVTFVKRTTNKQRTMTARTGVHRHLRGGPRAYDPADHNLAWVYDIRAGYRSIPLDAVLTIRFQGRTHDFTAHRAAA